VGKIDLEKEGEGRREGRERKSGNEAKGRPVRRIELQRKWWNRSTY
jgi:hypothetical protein